MAMCVCVCVCVWSREGSDHAGELVNKIEPIIYSLRAFIKHDIYNYNFQTCSFIFSVFFFFFFNKYPLKSYSWVGCVLGTVDAAVKNMLFSVNMLLDGDRR